MQLNGFKKYRLRERLWLILAGAVFVVLLWWLISWRTGSYVIPAPWPVFVGIWQSLGQVSTYKSIGATLLRLLVAIGISFTLAAIIGIIAGLKPQLYDFMRPFITTLRSLPTIVAIIIILPLIKIIYAPIIVTCLIIFPLIYEAFAAGIRSLDSEIVDALRLDGEYHPLAIFQVRLPAAFPFITLSIIQSLGLGLKVVIMSEIISGNNGASGLGFSINQAYADANFQKIFVYSCLAIIISIIFEIAAMNLHNRIEVNSVK